MLEDNHTDILGKACAGLGISPSEFSGAFSENPTDADLTAAAEALGLDAMSLIAIARGTYSPPSVVPPEGFAMFTTPFGDMLVNSYAVWDPASGLAAAIDTGADCDGLLELLKNRGLRLESILITHSHGDHIYDLDRLVEKTGARAWSSEAVSGAQPFEPGHVFTVGELSISSRLTFGHSPRGTTFVVDGLSATVAFSGDALFAGSMGGAKSAYRDALRTTREGILSLPPETLVGPGHGPLTTVGSELRNNPFFAGRSQA